MSDPIFDGKALNDFNLKNWHDTGLTVENHKVKILEKLKLIHPKFSNEFHHIIMNKFFLLDGTPIEKISPKTKIYQGLEYDQLIIPYLDLFDEKTYRIFTTNFSEPDRIKEIFTSIDGTINLLIDIFNIDFNINTTAPSDMKSTDHFINGVAKFFKMHSRPSHSTNALIETGFLPVRTLGGDLYTSWDLLKHTCLNFSKRNDSDYLRKMSFSKEETIDPSYERVFNNRCEYRKKISLFINQQTQKLMKTSIKRCPPDKKWAKNVIKDLAQIFSKQELNDLLKIESLFNLFGNPYEQKNMFSGLINALLFLVKLKQYYSLEDTKNRAELALYITSSNSDVSNKIIMNGTPIMAMEQENPLSEIHMEINSEEDINSFLDMTVNKLKMIETKSRFPELNFSDIWKEISKFETEDIIKIHSTYKKIILNRTEHYQEISKHILHRLRENCDLELPDGTLVPIEHKGIADIILKTVPKKILKIVKEVEEDPASNEQLNREQFEDIIIINEGAINTVQFKFKHEWKQSHLTKSQLDILKQLKAHYIQTGNPQLCENKLSQPFGTPEKIFKRQKNKSHPESLKSNYDKNLLMNELVGYKQGYYFLRGLTT